MVGIGYITYYAGRKAGYEEARSKMIAEVTLKTESGDLHTIPLNPELSFQHHLINDTCWCRPEIKPFDPDATPLTWSYIHNRKATS